MMLGRLRGYVKLREGNCVKKWVAPEVLQNLTTCQREHPQVLTDDGSKSRRSWDIHWDIHHLYHASLEVENISPLFKGD